MMLIIKMHDVDHNDDSAHNDHDVDHIDDVIICEYCVCSMLLSGWGVGGTTGSQTSFMKYD